MKAKLTWTLVGILLTLPIGLASAQAADYGRDHTYGRDHKNGKDLDETCRLLKLQAVSDYYGCLLRADDHESKQSGCDDRFERRFERADRISPRCEPLDNLHRTRVSVQSQAQDVLVGDVSQPPCASVFANGDQVTCWLNKPGENTAVSTVNLPALLTQLQTTPECAPCAQITTETVLWLQAWGAGGGTSSGGSGGFAQTVTSIADLESTGTLNLHYYLAQGGTHHSASGGQGGAATIVTAQDLTTNPSDEPEQSMIILIAGGGGGGGGKDGACVVGTASPHAGGQGGIAISTTGSDGEGVGQGANGGGGGKGGGQGVGGKGQGSSSNEVGHDGIGGLGGSGGEGAGDKIAGNPGWLNTGATPLTFADGQGGGGGNDSSSCTAGGGGGGGGWGGGGGGSHGNTSNRPGGGGGGGSFSIPSAYSDGAAPTTRPDNPAGGPGFVQLVFNLDPS